MGQQVVIRWLRVAVSVVFCLLALALLVLAARSYARGFAFVKTEGTGTQTRYGIDDGYFYMRRSYGPGFSTHDWKLNQEDLYRPRIKWVAGYAHRQIMVPYWAVVGVVVAGACLPWARFSLRTMLVATTFIAAGLGLSVWIVS